MRVVGCARGLGALDSGVEVHTVSSTGHNSDYHVVV